VSRRQQRNYEVSAAVLAQRAAQQAHHDACARALAASLRDAHARGSKIYVGHYVDARASWPSVSTIVRRFVALFKMPPQTWVRRVLGAQGVQS
jgi:hypothetical protein